MLRFAFLCFLLSSVLSSEVTAQSGQSGQSEPSKFDYYKQLYKRRTQFYFPPENPSTPAKENLGKILFFDPRLSGTNTMACSTCHNPLLGFGDGLPRAIGAGGKILPRHTPSLLNVAFSQNLQWDSEFTHLEDQALNPIRKNTEMNQDLKRLPGELKKIKGYVALFAEAFPGEEISTQNIARALAAFQRTIISGNSPWENFISGDDNALSLDARMGLVLFHEKARCHSCHMGWTLSDGALYDVGHKGDDRGRGALTKHYYENFKFRNPALLDVATHPPYMHDGSLATLADVVEFYDRGGDVKRPTLSSDVRPLNLTSQEKAQLLAFLNALTSKQEPMTTPDLPE